MDLLEERQPVPFSKVEVRKVQKDFEYINFTIYRDTTTQDGLEDLISAALYINSRLEEEIPPPSFDVKDKGKDDQKEAPAPVSDTNKDPMTKRIKCPHCSSFVEPYTERKSEKSPHYKCHQCGAAAWESRYKSGEFFWKK